MGVIPVLLWLSEAGAALAGWSWCGKQVGMALLALPKHQTQIHSGTLTGGTEHIPILHIAGTARYLAAHDRKREARIS